MARIKHTKNELKAQRDSLRRFERYLPTLQLKKQQLQMEVRHVEAKLEENHAETVRLAEALEPWIEMFAEPLDLGALLSLVEVRQTPGNVAGVSIPVLEEAVFRRSRLDLFESSPWIDDGLGALEMAARLRVERRFLEEQRRLLAEELRITTQRVNLFEKVKIPECREHIRVIRVFLGDQQTAEVARGKNAKGRAVEKERSA